MAAYKVLLGSGSPGSLGVVLSRSTLAEQWLPSALAQAPRVLRRLFAHPLNIRIEAPSINPLIPARVQGCGNSYAAPFSFGNLVVFGGRICSAGQADTGILLEVRGRPGDPPSARPRGGVLLYNSSLGNRMAFGPMLGYWGFLVRNDGVVFDSGPAAALPRARHSLLYWMLLCPLLLPRRCSGFPYGTKFTCQPFRHSRVGLAKRHDTIT